MEVADIRVHQPQRRIEIGDELDVFANQVADHVHVVGDQAGQIQDLGPEDPPPAERE